MANGKKKAAGKKRVSKRDWTIRLVAGGCALLMILSVLLSIL